MAGVQGDVTVLLDAVYGIGGRTDIERIDNGEERNC